MTMTKADVTAARKTMLQQRQGNYETIFLAVMNRDDQTLVLAKRGLQDTLDEENALNQIEGLIATIAAMP